MGLIYCQQIANKLLKILKLLKKTPKCRLNIDLSRTVLNQLTRKLLFAHLIQCRAKTKFQIIIPYSLLTSPDGLIHRIQTSINNRLENIKHRRHKLIFYKNHRKFCSRLFIVIHFFIKFSTHSYPKFLWSKLLDFIRKVVKPKVYFLSFWTTFSPNLSLDTLVKLFL